jgi:hypothetical protein
MSIQQVSCQFIKLFHVLQVPCIQFIISVIGVISVELQVKVTPHKQRSYAMEDSETVCDIRLDFIESCYEESSFYLLQLFRASDKQIIFS